MNILRPWYFDYPRWSMYLDILIRYPNYNDIEAVIPSHILVNVSKITLWETCEWIRFQDKYHRFPTLTEIKRARQLRNYTYEHLLTVDNYGEHF